MRGSWCWPDVETTLSDQPPVAVWAPNALLQRPNTQAVYARQGWDEGRLQAFGPWRFAPKPNPLAGQTEHLPEIPTDTPIEPFPSTDLPEGATSADVVTDLPVGLMQNDVDQMIEQARQTAWQEGHAAALSEWRAALTTQQQMLVACAQALHALQSDRQQMLEPLKRLSLHIAQELVRGELRMDSQVIERLIAGCIEALDHPAATILIQVSPSDLQRLQDLNLPGISLEADDSLQDGSVRAKVNDTQVQDLIEHRLADISRQIMGEAS